MKNQYVILTGSKNNAGDYLIKFRAKQLFAALRNDREIIDYNAWEDLTDEKLEIINSSKALILLGGPSLQKNMSPNIYRLRENLDDIKVPIITMGIGWKSINGEWKDSYDYSLSAQSLKLLDRVNKSGYASSVRDYHTLNVLNFKNDRNFLMTGCPAYYDLKSIENSEIKTTIKKVAFSLGVSFVESASMEKLMKQTILRLKDNFKDKVFEIVFHHSLSEKILVASTSGTSKHATRHNEFRDWLVSNDIKYVDISGSAENLMNYYSNVDLHIGYRVHAHIFMNSISKFSLLLSEDGRAKATEKVIGGIVIDGYLKYKNSIVSKSKKKIFKNSDRYIANFNSIEEIINNVNYEIKCDFLRLKNSRNLINGNFELMKKFIEQLP